MRESNNHDVDEFESKKVGFRYQLHENRDIEVLGDKLLEESNSSVISFLTNSQLSEAGSHILDMTPSPNTKRGSSQKRTDLNIDLADLLTPQGKLN